MKVKVLLPALIGTKEQKEMTDRCRRSIEDQTAWKQGIEYELIYDKKKYKYAIAGVWNAFFDKFRGKDYDFLMVCANDTILDQKCVQIQLACAEEYPDTGIISAKIENDIDKFSESKGKSEWGGSITTEDNLDPSDFMIRKGVIEDVGRIDNWFPVEFVERDYIYRSKLAGFRWVQPDVVLNYHPDHSGTVGNSKIRLKMALERYLLKWGGDALDEKYEHPFNDLSLNYKYCVL